MAILFYGDPHQNFEPLFQAVHKHRPKVVVLVGDLELDVPLAVKMRPLTALGVRVLWIHGNHDAKTPAMHDALFDAEGSFHTRAVSISEDSGPVTLAGLGGHYKGKVWFPVKGDEPARWNTRIQFLQDMGRSGGRYRDGLPLHQRQTIFPEDHKALAALSNVDILVTHEAPTSMVKADGQILGFGAIDDLARDMKVRLVVHGHHHQSYSGRTRDGIPVRGLGGAEPWLLVYPYSA